MMNEAFSPTEADQPGCGRAVLHALLSAGLEKTAACYVEEAGVHGTPQHGDDMIFRFLQKHELSSKATEHLQRALGGIHTTELPEHHSDTHLVQKMELGEQHASRIRDHHAKVRSLNFSELLADLPEDDGHRDKAQIGRQAALEENLCGANAELTKWKMELEKRKKELAAIELRLQQIQEAARFAKIARQHQQSMGLSTSDKSTDKLRKLLVQWDNPNGLRKVAPSIFAHVDKNHDGRLSWSGNEIRNFVRSLFRHHQIPVPSWPDTIWFELCQANETSCTLSMDLDEALRFAKTCFEMALHYVCEQSVEQTSNSPREPTSSVTKAPAALERVKSGAETALTKSDADGGLRTRCAEYFLQCDINRDGFIHWETGEVQKFIAMVFGRYSVSLPPWPTAVWIELFSACALNISNPLNFDDSLELTKHCLELRGLEARVQD